MTSRKSRSRVISNPPSCFRCPVFNHRMFWQEFRYFSHYIPANLTIPPMVSGPLPSTQFSVHFILIIRHHAVSATDVIKPTKQPQISLDNEQLVAHLLCFTIRPLQSCTCFEHYMLIIMRLNCIDAASGIVSQSVAVRCTGWERTALQFSLNLCTGWPLTERTIPDAASIQFNLMMMSM
jgi:hypothetical protein